MVESIENEVVVNAEPEHSRGINLGSDLIMTESEVPPNEEEIIVDNTKDETAICSEVDQNMTAERTDKDLFLSEKSLAAGEEDGRVNLEEITEGGDKEVSGFTSSSGSFHDQEALGINTEATGCKDVSPVASGDVDTLNENISCVEYETVAGRSSEIVGRNGETQAGTNLASIHEGLVMLAPAQNIHSTVASTIIHHEPTIDFVSVNNSDVSPVFSSVVNVVVLDSGQQQILGNATIPSSVSRQSEEFEVQMQSNLGKVKENTNGFTFGDNAQSVAEVCEQANETISSCAVDLVATASTQSVEASVRIDSTIGHPAEVQDYGNDTEMIDSGEVSEEPQELVSEISLSQSEDDDEQIGWVSHVQEKANDPENDGADMHLLEEDVDEEQVTCAEMSQRREERNSKHVALRAGSLTKEYHATYELPPETADQFSVNDLVWGKVKSHPWWPGQIFDPTDSSEKAMKHHRKDCYLVAYFGDKTFAWNEASQLKPFRAHFSQEEKQSSSEAFQNAIDCALEEVSRRVELGLACSCMPEETYDGIRFQIVENAGIQTHSSKREGGDGHMSSESFQPDKLVDYVRNLAQLPTCGANRLELTVAKAQLLSFYRLKGCQSLPEVQYFEGLENDVDTSLHQVSSLPTESDHAGSVPADDVSFAVRSKGPKRKHNLKDIVYHRRKEKSFSEMMGDSLFYYDEDYDSDEKLDGMLNSPMPSKKRKASNFLDDEPKVPESTRTVPLAKASQTATPNSRQSFKIGDCIRRAASQLTGTSSTMKSTDDGNNEQAKHDIDKSLDVPEDAENENTVISAEETSPDDFLWEFYLIAQDPRRAHGFSKSVVSYFSEFRDVAVSAQRKISEKSSTARGRSGRKRKSSLCLGVSPEAFEFDDRKDSYWADMVVENNSEAKQPERRGRKRKDHQLGTADPDWADVVVENSSEAKQPARRSRKRKDDQVGTGDAEKPTKSTKRRYSKKQNVNGSHEELTVEQSSVDEVKQELPTELILNFGDNSVPSIADLNRMFRRFGPLKESETEVDRENSRARLVYKTGSDAEIAYSSAATFNIFGPITVNYQLGQTPPASSHSLVPPLAHCTEDAA